MRDNPGLSEEMRRAMNGLGRILCILSVLLMVVGFILFFRLKLTTEEISCAVAWWFVTMVLAVGVLLRSDHSPQLSPYLVGKGRYWLLAFAGAYTVLLSGVWLPTYSRAILFGLVEGALMGVLTFGYQLFRYSRVR